MCQGATQNYAGMLACRFFLGLAEAGFYPGVLYHLSFWYPTHRLPLRIVSSEALAKSKEVRNYSLFLGLLLRLRNVFWDY